MRHDVVVEGHAFRLRPVDEDDAPFIVAVRTMRAAFLNPGAASVHDQLAWLARYFERANDYYFVVEARAGQREGLVGIYDIDPAAGTGEWGRWVLQEGSMGAVESALLTYRCAFGRLGLRRVRCRTLVDNAHVVAFHDSCGLRRTSHLVRVGGEAAEAGRDAVEHVLDRADWPGIEARLDALALRAAQRRAASPKPATRVR